MAAQSPSPALARITREDALGQLRRREGAMARLGSENGVSMLDWVEALPRALADPQGPERVEAEARQLLARGIRHVLWAGMGGSVLSVQVLRALGFCGDGVPIYPLDSTDPASLNAVLRALARAKGVSLPGSGDTSGMSEPDAPEFSAALFGDVAMVGVAMGRTSEEPITHLEWFAGLLQRGSLPLDEHLLVLSIPGSYLERYAISNDVPRLPLQLDGGSGTPGRMSAPGTRVFLLPVALDLAARNAAPGTLRAVLARAWAASDLDGATADPASNPYVRLAAVLADSARDGACALYTAFPPELDPLRWWMEQLMEESLGKGGKGVIVFADQPLADGSHATLGSIRLRITTEREEPAEGIFTITEPLLGSPDADARLAGLAATFLGLQLTMALYGYLNDIQFAGQPAVEAYKSRARALRNAGDPVRAGEAACTPITAGRLTLLPPSGSAPATTSSDALAARLRSGLTYLDLTVNGELSAESVTEVEQRLRHLGNARLGVPVKLRRAPASYHSTEQSEMDGPAGVVSLRALALRSEPILIGSYDATFLRAQAVGTWMAMNEHDRTCYLLLYDGTNEELGPALRELLDDLAHKL